MNRIKKRELLDRIEKLENPEEEIETSNLGKLRVIVRWNKVLRMWTAHVQICETVQGSSWNGFEPLENWISLDDHCRTGDTKYYFSSLDREKAVLDAWKAAKKYEKLCAKNRVRSKILSGVRDMGESVIYVD